MNEFKVRVLVPSVFVLVALVPVSLFWLYMEMPGGDAYRYLVLSDWFSESISNGIWYPRWMVDMNGGYGYPQFVFYQPGYFYVSHLFVLVEAPLLRATLTLSLVAGIGAWGAYRLARSFSGRAASLFFILIFQLTPYHFVQLYARGDFSEWTAMQLSSWPIYFLYRLGSDNTRTGSDTWMVTGLAAALASMCYAHPITLIGYLPIFTLMEIFVVFSVDSSKRGYLAVRLLISTTLALALSSPYWLTAVTMTRYVNIAAAQLGHFDPQTHLLSPLSFFWSEQDQLSTSLKLSFELGPIHFLLALVGAWIGRKDPFILGASFIYCLLLVLMTPVAAPFWRIYPFYLMQFPWRLLSFVAAFQLVCIIGLAKANGVCTVKRAVLGVGLVTACLAWQSDEMALRPIPADVLEIPETRSMILASFPDGVGFVSPGLVRPSPKDLKIMEANSRKAVPFTALATLDGAEWSPLSALHHPLKAPRGQSMVETLSGAASIVPTEGSSKFKFDYLIEATEASTLLVNQLYLPGWTAVVDGIARLQRDLEQHVAADGRIRILVPPGTHRLSLWYDGAPGWWWRNLLSAIIVACCIGFMVRHARVGATGRYGIKPLKRNAMPDTRPTLDR